MKKLLVLLLVLVSTVVLMGCTAEKGKYVEGEYEAEVDKTSVVINVDKDGFITEVYIDVEYTKDGVDTTKKALGYAYRMHNGAGDLTDEEYLEYLEENDLLEWFEQIELIEEQIVKDQGFTVKDNDEVDAPAGVTITNTTYYEVIGLALAEALKPKK